MTNYLELPWLLHAVVFMLLLVCSAYKSNSMALTKNEKLTDYYHRGVSAQLVKSRIKRSQFNQQASIPTINVPPKSTVVKEGGTAIFYCQATGKVSWSRVNSNLPVGRTITQKMAGNLHLLMISNVNKNDQDQYQCTSTNSAQGVQATAVATLTVKARTVVTAVITPKSVITTQGANVTFTCRATGSPLPTITWSKAFEALQSPILGTKIHHKNAQRQISSTLTIRNITQGDGGLYVCMAKSNKKFVKRTAYLVVVQKRKKMTFARKPLDKVTVVEGDDVKMTCQGLNADHTVWTSRTQKSTLTRAVQLNGTLTIPQSNSGDSGMYTCQSKRTIYGIEQMISISTILTVIQKSRGLERSSILSNSFNPPVYTQILLAYLDAAIGRQRNWVRCWHADEDGWDSRRHFHHQCDFKGPTVTIVRVFDYVFGFYTNAVWKSRGDVAGPSPYISFIFSLYNKHYFHPVKMTLRGYVNDDILSDSKYRLPNLSVDMKLIRNTFGSESSAKPFAFYPPPGCEIDKVCDFYTRSKWFRPNDIEVFYEA